MHVEKVFLCAIITLAVFKLEINAARILAIYSTPSISHQVVFRHLTLELIKRGHEVVVVTTDPAFPKGEAPANLTEIDVHDVSYKHWDHFLQSEKGDKNGILDDVILLLKRFTEILDLQFQNAEIQEILKKDRKYFDLLILEACIRSSVGLVHLFDAPVIQFSSFGALMNQYALYGSPIHPLLFPTPGTQRLYNLSLWEKTLELLKVPILRYVIFVAETYDYYIMKKHFGQDVPSFQVLYQRLGMLFVNEHPIWNENRPVGSNIVFIGGIHQPAEKELPKDLKQFLDSSKNGVIYMSFGTNVIMSALPKEKVEVIKKVLSELPYDVLLKWDSELEGKSDNVKTAKWFPQPDLLKHPKVKLFITQGGLQSTEEAIDAGVPVIGIPMLIDQWYNVEKYVRHNIGLQLDIQSLNEELFKGAIEEVIHNKSYKENIIRLRTLMRQSPIKPLDLAVFWVEHIIEFGADHLRPPTFQIGWLEYYEVKLVLIVLSILISILIIATLVLRVVLYKTYQILCSMSKLKRD